MKIRTLQGSLGTLGFVVSFLVPGMFGASLAVAQEQNPPEEIAPEVAPEAMPGTLPAEESVEQEQDLSPEEMRLIEASLEADLEEASVATEKVPGVFSKGVQSVANGLDMALILDVTAAYFSETPQQTGAHDPNRTGVTFQQLELAIGSNIDPYLRLDVNMVFSEFGVEVEEAYFSTLALPWNLKVRGGQLMTQFGRLNPTHPHSWSFLDQPLVNGKFLGGESSRGLGAEVSWLSPLPWFVELVGSATHATGECCARSFYGGEDLGVEVPGDLLYTTAVKQFFPFGTEISLMWGLSGQFGPNPSGQGNRTEIYGTDIYLRWRPVDSVDRTAVSLQAEAMVRRRQVPGDVLQDFGGYAQMVWNINARWETGVRHEFVSGVENDPIETIWFDDRQRTSAQLTFYPSHFSRFRLQGMWDQPTYLDHSIFGVMLGAEVLAGAHGAHTY